jgi:hypothetical protein
LILSPCAVNFKLMASRAMPRRRDGQVVAATNISQSTQSFASCVHGLVRQFRFKGNIGSAAASRNFLFLDVTNLSPILRAACGQSPQLGGFHSRVLGVGPQIGYIFPVGDMKAFLGAKAYGEFDAASRPSGWNAWLTFSISEAAPTTVTPTKHLITK